MISTMEMINILVLTVVGVILASQGNVEACTCEMPGNFTYNVCRNHELVALVSVLSAEQDDGDGQLYYIVRVAESYMGPAKGMTRAYRQVEPLSTCEGRTMDLGENYLFTGSSYEKDGKSFVQYDLCRYVQAWEEILTDPDHDSMYDTLKALDTECPPPATVAAVAVETA